MFFRVLKNLLHGLHLPITNKQLQSLIKDQWFYGSIRTIVEVLSELNIDSKVYQLEEEDFYLIESPVIVYLKDDENRVVVVVEIQENLIKYYDPIANDYKTERKSKFFEKWTGIVLIPFTDEQSGDPDYLKHLKKERQKKLANILIFAGISVGIVALLIQTFFSYPQFFLIWLALFAIKTIALIVVAHIVKIEFGESNTLISKICNTTDCGKVLNSKASKLFAWLSMGDVGVIYFGFGTLLLIIASFTNELESIVYLLVFLNLFTLPYTFFSVGYQRFVLKTWCPFCLTVMGILWIEFVLGLFVGWIEIFPLQPFLFLIFAFYAIVVSIGWLVLKRLLVRTNIFRGLQMHVNIFKKNTEIFKVILANQDAVPEFSSSFSDIVVGNKDATNELVAIISTNCSACVALYKAIKIFLTIHSDIIRVIFRFKTEERVNSKNNQIIDYVLTLYKNNMEEQALSVLDEWYNMEYKDMNALKMRCNINQMVISNEAIKMRNDYHNWLVSAEITGVPAMILNNKLVPNYYTFHDIQYFLKRL